MSETILLMVRHGQTDWNLVHRWQGQTDIPMNANGINQARQAAGTLKTEPIDGIICSDLSRARQTAELIAEYHPDVPLTIDKRIREISFGSWEGLSWAEVEAQYPDEAKAWRRNEMAGPPNGETFVELAARTNDFLESMRGRGGRWIVASHGGTIRSMTAGVLGIQPSREWQFQIKNLSISELALYDNATVLNRWNDTNHLQTYGRIRPISIAVIEHNGNIFVGECKRPENGSLFYRPLGGGIELGEKGAETVVREFREEMDAELVNVGYLATLENIFEYDGDIGHELVQVYRADFSDSKLYDLQTPQTICNESGVARWMPLANFAKPDAPPLYPDGLLELLQKTAA